MFKILNKMGIIVEANENNKYDKITIRFENTTLHDEFGFLKYNGMYIIPKDKNKYKYIDILLCGRICNGVVVEEIKKIVNSNINLKEAIIKVLKELDEELVKFYDEFGKCVYYKNEVIPLKNMYNVNINILVFIKDNKPIISLDGTTVYMKGYDSDNVKMSDIKDCKNFEFINTDYEGMLYIDTKDFSYIIKENINTPNSIDKLIDKLVDELNYIDKYTKPKNTVIETYKYK